MSSSFRSARLGFSINLNSLFSRTNLENKSKYLESDNRCCSYQGNHTKSISEQIGTFKRARCSLDKCQNKGSSHWPCCHSPGIKCNPDKKIRCKIHHAKCNSVARKQHIPQLNCRI